MSSASTALRLMLRRAARAPPRRRAPVRRATGGGDDPDSFRGPGGLTGRELFELTQRAAARDAEHYGAAARGAAAARARAAAATPWQGGDHAASLSVRELQERLDLLDVKYDDCVEKRELVERYKATAAERAQDFFAGRGQASGTLY